MKKMKKAIAFLCTVLLSLSLVLNSVVYADEKSGTDDARKAAVTAQMAEVQKQINDKKKEINDAKGALNKAKSNTNNAKAQMQAAERQGAALAEEISLLESQIDLLNQNIEAVELSEEEQYEKFCQQVRQEEERGTLSYWSILFKASSFDDLLSRIDFVNAIMEYDQQIMGDLQEIRAELKENRAELESQENELDDAHQQQTVLAAQYAELYKDYKQTEEDLQAAYNEAVAEEAALEASMKEVERIAAELGVTGGSSGGYIWPVKVNPIYITSKFGPRAQPTAGASTLHNGIDIGVSYVPVYAAKSGTVTLAGTNGGFGNCVIISHGTNYTTTYGHLSSINVKVGDVVSQGQQIATSGNTGTSTGPHLDFRIMEAGVYKDPLSYLSGYTLLC